MAKRDSKKPSFGNIEPVAEKKPRFFDPPALDGKPISWRFSSCDRNGPFSWSGLIDPAYKCILEKLHEYESKNYDEITRAGSHPIEVYRLSDAAKARLKEIQMDDIESLMSFRCEGDDRVWCIPQNGVMRILWYDPDHMVYPVAKDKNDRNKHSGRKK